MDILGGKKQNIGEKDGAIYCITKYSFKFFKIFYNDFLYVNEWV